MAARSIEQVVDGVPHREGGLEVRRPFPSAWLDRVDPFLLLDELGPMMLEPGKGEGIPDHPHRGFETVTYLLSGEIQHHDSQGHSGRIGAGEVQWMTAGAGIIHSEMPTAAFRETGGRLHGFQLWVNLPRRDKLMKPRYQDIPSSRIPSGRSPDGLAAAKVIAGEAFGVEALIQTRTPIVYLHFTLDPGARVAQHVPPHFNAFAYIISGEPRFGPEERAASQGQMLLFGNDGDEVTMSLPKGNPAASDLLVLAGAPLNEPVARYGPFVMNTNEEIKDAIEDFRHGRMG